MYQYHHQEDQDGWLLLALHAWSQHRLDHLQGGCAWTGPEAWLPQQGHLRVLEVKNSNLDLARKFKLGHFCYSDSMTNINSSISVLPPKQCSFEYSNIWIFRRVTSFTCHVSCYWRVTCHVSHYWRAPRVPRVHVIAMNCNLLKLSRFVTKEEYEAQESYYSQNSIRRTSECIILYTLPILY